MSKNIKVKPGKSQSMAGFAGGIVFCLIGLFIAIPTFGLFGIFWTLIAAVITVMNAKNAFTDEGVPTYEIEVEDEEGSKVSSLEQKNSVEERLRLVDRLYQEGTITNEEREAKRKEILDEI